ncbi:hypothetical protein D3C87_1720060 [compost metagenome]
MWQGVSASRVEAIAESGAAAMVSMTGGLSPFRRGGNTDDTVTAGAAGAGAGFGVAGFACATGSLGAEDSPRNLRETPDALAE